MGNEDIIGIDQMDIKFGNACTDNSNFIDLKCPNSILIYNYFINEFCYNLMSFKDNKKKIALCLTDQIICSEILSYTIENSTDDYEDIIKCYKPLLNFVVAVDENSNHNRILYFAKSVSEKDYVDNVLEKIENAGCLYEHQIGTSIIMNNISSILDLILVDNFVQNYEFPNKKDIFNFNTTYAKKLSLMK